MNLSAMPGRVDCEIQRAVSQSATPLAEAGFIGKALISSGWTYDRGLSRGQAPFE